MSNEFNIKAFLKTLTDSPGVYRMLDAQGEIIYVGKAKQLRKRVSSYFNRRLTDRKTQTMVGHIKSIEVTVTETEKDALLLESNLIKKHRPRYNVIFRDDKSYPYIFLSADPFPRIAPHRGAHNKKGDYFGPYPSMGSVRMTLNLLQKVFPIRTCENHFFKNRTRPCLQYQIKRCTAPCVEYISVEEYAQDVDSIRQFLQGKSQQILQRLAQRMETASQQREFETAARLRDQLIALRKLQEQQYITTGSQADADVLAVAEQQDHYCIQVLLVRDGAVLGTKSYYPKAGLLQTGQAVLQAFIAQYYTVGVGAKNLPQVIVVDQRVALDEALAALLQEQHQRVPTWVSQPRGRRRQWLEMARRNAHEALAMQLAQRQSMQARFLALQQTFDLPEIPQRLECFDISHSHGEATVASCVVFDRQGPAKQQYRRFNIKDVQPGDDYAAIKQALMRRYQRLQKENQTLPDVVLIDGGKGQLHQAVDVFNELNIHDVLLLGVSKGETRKPGLEQLWLPGKKLAKVLDSTDPALHLIQQIRDEAHRFAITGHRGQRDKKRQRSPLEGIPGVGPKKRHALIQHFGGWRGVQEASVAELMKVPGISRQLAEAIQAALKH